MQTTGRIGEGKMRISRFGGIIAAASKSVAQPMLQIGTIPIIKRIVITYQQAGIFPIVVITGKDEEEVKHQLSSYGVIFLQVESPEQPELMDSVRVGMEYLYNKCERIVFTPVNVPMFTPATLLSLMDVEGEVVVPSFEHRGGHPVIVHNDIVPRILSYEGSDGLRGAFAEGMVDRVFVEVADKGVLSSVSDEKGLEQQLSEHNSSILKPVLHMQLEKEIPFFNVRLKILLFLIDDTENVKLSCQRSGLAYSKAWDMINTLEQNLGFAVVKRNHGGQDGGSTVLTWKGRSFLAAYQQFEEQLQRTAQTEFYSRFVSTNIL